MAAALIAGFALLFIGGAASILAAIASADADFWAAHSLRVRDANARLFSFVQDAESGQRGFLLTADPSYLDSFNIGVREIPGAEQTLRRLTADNPAQQVRLDALYPVIDRKLKELDQTIELARAGRNADALAVVKSNLGRDLMTTIRKDFDDFDMDETALQAARTARAAALRVALLTIIVLAVAVGGFLAFLVATGARRGFREMRAQTLALQTEMAQRQRAEAALRQAQKMDALGQLTGGIAHDFNNMLSIIVGNLDLLLRRFSSVDARTRLYAENALSGARRAAELTKRLLAFSRLQPLQPSPTDVNRCVSGMSELLRRTLGERIELETVLGGGLWRAIVDPSQLESAILNLAINARDAMDGSGRLTIETANTELDQAYADAHDEVSPGQYVMIAVTDTGCGMSEEVMRKAFDPFFTTKEPGEGTGLGLSQVHGFTKQSKGHVKLYSEPGKGTTVKLYLPRDLSKSALVHDAPKPMAEPLSVEPKGHVVLVVEDDSGVRGFTVSALRELGYEAIEADTVAAARSLFAADPRITVLLTDVVMPNENGRELAASLMARRPDLAVLYMTGYTRNAIVHNGTLDPGVRLLSKPFTLDDLKRELRAVILAGAKQPTA